MGERESMSGKGRTAERERALVELLSAQLFCVAAFAHFVEQGCFSICHFHCVTFVLCFSFFFGLLLLFKLIKSV